MKTVGVYLCVIVFCGCAAIGTQREISPDNMFYSKNPHLIVQLGSDLSYKGMFNIDSLESSSEGGTIRTEQEYHIWQDKTGRATAIILIMKLADHKFFWYSNMFKKNDQRAISVAGEKINGKAWQTRLGLTSPNERQDQKLFELGLPHGKINLSKTWARKNSKTIKTYIVYLEDIDQKPWLFRHLSSGGRVLSAKESGYLNAFLDRARARIHIVE